MKLLRDMIGEEIIANVPSMDREILQVLRLHGVEEGGIWVESENLTQRILAKLDYVASSKAPLFFLPFHEIRFALQSTDKISLSQKAFGM
jgi:hypothetical protein